MGNKYLSHAPVYYQPAMTYGALNLNGQHNTQHSHFHHVDLSFYFGFNLLHYCNKTKENKTEEKKKRDEEYILLNALITKEDQECKSWGKNTFEN